MKAGLTADKPAGAKAIADISTSEGLTEGKPQLDIIGTMAVFGSKDEGESRSNTARKLT